MGKLITVKARFIDKVSGTPLSSDGIVVKLFDKDIVNDDFLGESKLNDNGNISIQFDLDHAQSFDSPGEDKPDLYFSLYKYGHLLFQSEVIENVDFSHAAEFSTQEGFVFDAGTYLV